MEYNELKDTDAIWIPKIPKHWELIKVRHLFKESTIKGFPDEPLLVASQEHGVVNKDVFGKRTMEATKDFHLLKLVEEGNFVISLRSFQGGIELAYQRGIISPAYTILTEKKAINKRYFKHLFKSKPFISLMTLCVKGIRDGQNIDFPTFKGEYLPVPPIEEQERIGSYLDRKIQQIQEFIAKKERLIELLEEEKSVYINEVINNYKTISICLKYLCNGITDGSHFSPQTLTEGKSYVTVTDIGKENNIDLTNCKKISEEDFTKLERTGCRPNYGDILLTKDGTIGRAYTVRDTNDFVALSSLAIITPSRKKILPELLRYILISPLSVDQMFSKIQGSALTRLTIGLIKNLVVIYPSSKEDQLNIIKSIEDKHIELNKIISKAKSEIEKAKEYQESLITQIVTGQLKVPQKANANLEQNIELGMVAEPCSAYRSIKSS